MPRIVVRMNKTKKKYIFPLLRSPLEKTNSDPLYNYIALSILILKVLFNMKYILRFVTTKVQRN